MAELYYNAKVYVEKGHYEQAVLVEDGIIRRNYRRLSQKGFNIWQRREEKECKGKRNSLFPHWR